MTAKGLDVVQYMEHLQRDNTDKPSTRPWYDYWEPEAEADAIANLDAIRKNLPKLPPGRRA